MAKLPKRQVKKGFVYLLRADNGCVKIGRSVNPRKRAEAFKTLPFGIKLIHTIQTNDMGRLEFDLHSRYFESHVCGEWFALDDETVSSLCSITERVYTDESPEIEFKYLWLPLHLWEPLKEYADSQGISMGYAMKKVVLWFAKQEGIAINRQV